MAKELQRLSNTGPPYTVSGRVPCYADVHFRCMLDDAVAPLAHAEQRAGGTIQLWAREEMSNIAEVVSRIYA